LHAVCMKMPQAARIRRSTKGTAAAIYSDILPSRYLDSRSNLGRVVRLKLSGRTVLAHRSRLQIQRHLWNRSESNSYLQKMKLPSKPEPQSRG
jgi:hypothetical protein